MKVLTRDFSARERILLLLLGVIIVAMIYYLAVDQPVRSGISAAKTELESIQMQVDSVNARVDAIAQMEEEMDQLEASGTAASRMPSYNASKREVDFLHNTLAQTLDYYVGFTQTRREGDQIRRDFSLQYRCANFASAVEVMRQLENSEIRCLIGDQSVTPADSSSGSVTGGGAVQVSCTATFYETMHDGTPDKELPVDTAAPAAEPEE